MLNNPRCSWFKRLSRQLLFTQSERWRLLTVLRVQVESGLPEATIFANLEASGYSEQVRDLAKVSQLGSVEMGHFTAYWHSDGFFPEKDVRIIEAALTSGTLVDAIDLLLKGTDKGHRFSAAVLGGSSSYLVFAAGFLITMLGMGQERATLERVFDELMLFTFLDLLATWSLPVLVLAVLFALIYSYGRARWLGRLRSTVKALLIFKTYDRQFAAQACRLAGHLSQKGVTIDTVLNVLSSVYKTPYQQSTLEDCRRKLEAGYPVAEALDQLLESRYRYFLASMAPAESEQQLGNAFPAVASLIDVDIAEAFEHMKVYLITVSLILSLGIFMALMEIMTGANMTPT